MWQKIFVVLFAWYFIAVSPNDTAQQAQSMLVVGPLATKSDCEMQAQWVRSLGKDRGATPVAYAGRASACWEYDEKKLEPGKKVGEVVA